MGALYLSLAQAILLVFAQWREQVTDDATLTRLDLGGDCHAGRQAYGFILNLHVRSVERDARSVHLALIFGRRFWYQTSLLRLVLRRILQIVLAHRIVRDRQHRPVQQAVAREVKGRDLDLRILRQLDKADVAVG